MPARVTHHLNTAQVHALLTSRTGGVVRDIYRRGKRVETAAKRLAPVDTGRMRSTITTGLFTRGSVVGARVGTDVLYARFVIRGTGVYGPHNTPIVPRSAKVLKFTPRGSAKTIYVKSVRGVPPRPFLTEALVAARN